MDVWVNLLPALCLQT